MLKYSLVSKLLFRWENLLYVVACRQVRRRFLRWSKAESSTQKAVIHYDERMPDGREEFLVSIILLCYNNLELTRLCIESVLRETLYQNYELIVVDNHSTDGTVEYLTGLEDVHAHIRVHALATNVGFPAGVNYGVRQAAGEIIILINNDVIVTPAWVSKFVSTLEDKRIGLLGPVCNASGNESKIPIGYKSLSELNAFSKFIEKFYRGKMSALDVLPFHCVGFRREIWDRVGELDECFGIGMFEDDDYCLRVKQQGYSLVCAEDIYIHHWGRASFSKLDQEFHDALYQTNKAKFEQKWNISWKPHQHRQYWK